MTVAARALLNVVRHLALETFLRTLWVITRTRYRVIDFRQRGTRTPDTYLTLSSYRTISALRAPHTISLASK